MLICPNCKKEFADGETYCDVCGTTLTEANANNENAAPAAESGAKKVGFIEMVKLIPKKWLMIGAGAVAGLIVVIVLASLLFGPKKPNFDLEDAADNLEDEDYTSSSIGIEMYEDDEDKLDIGVVEELNAINDDDYLTVTVYATKKLADMAYDALERSHEAQLEYYKATIKRLKYMIKKFEDELEDREVSWSEYDNMLEQYEERLEDLEKEFKEYKDEYVFGQSGKKVWEGTKDAIEDSKG